MAPVTSKSSGDNDLRADGVWHLFGWMMASLRRIPLCGCKAGWGISHAGVLQVTMVTEAAWKLHTQSLPSAWMHVGNHVGRKCPPLWPDLNQNWNMSIDFSKPPEYKMWKFIQQFSCCYRETDRTKLTNTHLCNLRTRPGMLLNNYKKFLGVHEINYF
jgi:hypothetical protein